MSGPTKRLKGVIVGAGYFSQLDGSPVRAIAIERGR
jgi:hypothetical protein